METNHIDNETKNVINSIRESINIDESDHEYKLVEIALEKFHKFLIRILNSKLPDTLEKNLIIKHGIQTAGGFIADLTVKLINSFFRFLYVVVRRPKVWSLIWNSCVKTWNENADRGISTQIYAFTKKFLAYVCEICIQCFIKTLESSGMTLLEEEKSELAKNLFNSEEDNVD